jgi:hypothetical protein
MQITKFFSVYRTSLTSLALRTSTPRLFVTESELIYNQVCHPTLEANSVSQCKKKEAKPVVKKNQPLTEERFKPANFLSNLDMT